jgi:hypothetical protein
MLDNRRETKTKNENERERKKKVGVRWGMKSEAVVLSV